jgi:methyltransferase (TIGR00027 family)
VEENQISRTAKLASIYRAYHSMQDDNKIFDDFLAKLIIGDSELASFKQQMVAAMKSFNPQMAASFNDEAEIFTYMMQAMAATPLILSRSRYTEDCLKKVVSNEVQQYVILGAGMDTFAFWHKELLNKLQVFEVDHPATQDFKRSRIADLGWEQPEQLHFVPVDFTKDSLEAAFKGSSYNPEKLSFFSWLGVTYYLPREAVFKTLYTIANVAPAGSTVIFEYLDTDAFIPERAAQRVQLLLRLANQEKEPMQAGFDPSTLATDLNRLGLQLKEDLGPSDIQKLYFENSKDRYYACEHAHFAWAVVK